MEEDSLLTLQLGRKKTFEDEEFTGRAFCRFRVTRVLGSYFKQGVYHALQKRGPGVPSTGQEIEMCSLARSSPKSQKLIIMSEQEMISMNFTVFE